MYGHNFGQDIQLQVIIKKNDNVERTNANALSTQMKEAANKPQDDTVNVHYGKNNFTQSKDFRIEPRIITGNTLARSNSTENLNGDSKCFGCLYTSDSISNIILYKHITRFWKHFKWPLSLCVLCIFIGIVTYTCVRALKNRSLVRNCFNSSATFSCSLATTSNTSIPNSNFTSFENGGLEKSGIFQLYSHSNKTATFTNVPGAILEGSTTILRPVAVPHNFQASFTERNNIVDSSKNDNNVIKKQQRFQKNDPKPFENSTDNNKSETLSKLGFTSGHQNNFGIPIEEDERVLRLLNEELIKLEQYTESSKVVSRTEGLVAVSPTVPLIIHDLLETSIVNSDQSDDTQCQSTSLPMCRGILEYDLTSSKSRKLESNALDLKAFEELFASNCSARAVEFVCSLLEPECRPKQFGFLQPCKRICKSILEACSNLVVNSDILTYTFDCDKYPDSDDKNVCEDPTRRKKCLENEFKCQDMTCIPNQWQCDNIKDCSIGEDEFGCLVCNSEEFRCKSNEKCLPIEYKCDTNRDCTDGSDEFDCMSEIGDLDPQTYPRKFSFRSFYLSNDTIGDEFTTVSDDRLASASGFNESQVTEGGSFLESSDVRPISTNLARFQDIKEIMMTSDSENKFKISQIHNSTQKYGMNRLCSEHELRCVSGMCITVDQLCDKVMDCHGGEDELSCAYEEESKP